MAEAAHPDANIIFGAMVDEKIADQVWVTVVATGYGDRPGAPGGAARRRERGRPRAARAARAARAGRPARSNGNGLGDIDVPEFMPRG